MKQLSTFLSLATLLIMLGFIIYSEKRGTVARETFSDDGVVEPVYEREAGEVIEAEDVEPLEDHRQDVRAGEMEPFLQLQIHASVRPRVREDERELFGAAAVARRRGGTGSVALLLHEAW